MGTPIEFDEPRREPPAAGTPGAVAANLVRAVGSARTAADIMAAYLQAVHDRFGTATYVGVSLPADGTSDYQITRLITPDGRDHVPQGEPMVDNPDRPRLRGGFIESLIPRASAPATLKINETGERILDHDLSPYRSAMIAPGFRDGQLRGFAVLLSPEPAGFRQADADELTFYVNLLASSFAHLTTAERLLAAQARIRSEVRRIAEIQRALLPPSLPEVPGFTFATSYVTAMEAGGDFYDLFPMTPPDAAAARGSWGVLIGDVSGHGPAAAVVMAMIASYLNAAPAARASPGALLARVNEHLLARPLGAFATAVVVRLDSDSGRLTYASAGHPPSILRRAASGERLRLDDAGNLPLAVSSNVVYEEATISMEPGDLLVLYTDGLIEAGSPAGDMFGIDGVHHAMTALSGGASDAVERLRRAVAEHEEKGPPLDDQTIVAVRRDPAVG